jgi:hypothetical protein
MDQYELDKQELVCVTMTVNEWANVIAAVGMSPLDLFIKDQLNSTIYDCVTRQERALS